MHTLKINMNDIAYKHFMSIFKDRFNVEILEDYSETFKEERDLNIDEKECLKTLDKIKSGELSEFEEIKDVDEYIKKLKDEII